MSVRRNSALADGDLFLLTEGVGQEMECPSHPSLWWFAASHRREPCFRFTIELAVPVLPPGSIMQGCFDTFYDRALAQPFDCGTVDLDRLGGLGVGPLLCLGTTVSFEEVTGAGDGTGRGFPLLDCGAEQEALGIAERNDVKFRHGVVLREGTHPPCSREERLEEMVV